jgi:hypothetical protein
MGTKTEQKARKEYVCESCKKKILVGTTYIKFSPSRFVKAHIRCIDCPPRRSELTTSDFLSQMYDLEDQIGDFKVDIPDKITKEVVDGISDDIKSFVESITSELENLQSDVDDKSSNMPDNLQSSPVATMLEERSSAVGDMISELEGIDTDFDYDSLVSDAKDSGQKLREVFADAVDSIVTDIGSICYNGE